MTSRAMPRKSKSPHAEVRTPTTNGIVSRRAHGCLSEETQEGICFLIALLAAIVLPCLLAAML